MPEDLVEGWTEPVDQTLLADGATLDGSGMSIELSLFDATGKAITISGSSAWLDATTGKARFTPAVGDLLASHSPYRARWKVTSGGAVAYFPNGEADVWTVRR